MQYKNKYLKYKSKYLQLKNQIGGVDPIHDPVHDPIIVPDPVPDPIIIPNTVSIPVPVTNLNPYAARNRRPAIVTIKEDPININRRIKVNGMCQEINKLIDFDKYGLPKIDCKDVNLDELEPTIEIIKSPKIYANDPDIKKIENFIAKII